MIPQSTIEAVKQVSIVSYLLSIRVEPVKYSGSELVYFSPKQTEHTPSFFVNPDKNVFHDYTTDERGDIIRLVQYLTGCNFIESVQILQKFEPVTKTQTFLFSGSIPKQNPNKSQLKIEEVSTLKDSYLFRYIHKRAISTEIAKRYLVEVSYRFENRKRYAVGFKNDKGGLEIRNEYLKSSTSPKWLTTFIVPHSKTIDIFEGFFDFLSSLEFFGLLRPRNTTIVLNSVTNLNHVLDSLKNYKVATLYFDNDLAGQKAKDKVVSTGIKVIDGSKHYHGYKDFNEYITQKPR